MASLPRPLREDADAGTLAEDEVRGLWQTLTAKQQSWLAEYLSNGLNATQAVRDSEYNPGSEQMAQNMGYQNKHHEKMRRLIEHACRRHMSENEALQRLSSLARVSFADFLSFDDEGEPFVDLQKARDRGVMHHIKSIKWDTRRVSKNHEERYVKDLKLRDPVKPNIEILKTLGVYDDESDVPENVTFNAWIGDIREHLSGSEQSPWPQVDGEPNQQPEYLDGESPSNE